ncbi:MAG: DUF1501 domain-containing protein [Pirellulaceae bacterium]|nr:DUF1501 domain-containing protein [Pirellulaceae bacterium]
MIHRPIRCDGMGRRDMLKVGLLTGWGLGLSQYFARLAVAQPLRPATAKACILVWLDGGPSHLETFDLKPDAPTEVKGPFRPIATNVPGIEYCELLAETAKLADKLTILRSVTSPLGEHGLANQYLLTGYEPTPSLVYPSFGSAMMHLQQQNAALPAYVAIPRAGSAGAGFLGSTCEPFATQGDPAKMDFRVPDIDFFPGVDAQRITRRRSYLAQLDQTQAEFERSAPSGDQAFAQAYRLVTSNEAKSAFDLSQEPQGVRSRYGPRTFGQSCLLARRLVERGVPFVTINYTGWDTHSDLVLQLKSGYSGADPGVGLIPTFDLGFSALLRDLSERGLLEQTLVVAMGEFGRTPKLNSQGGRDHWPRVFSVAMAGGGVRGGQFIGSSDRMGESPRDQPITPKDLAFSVYTLLGLQPSTELLTPDGRPVQLNQGGHWIKGLT